MKKRLLSGLLAVAMLFTTGCTSILEREHATATPHSDAPEGVGNEDALRVENYQEMVNALLYLVKERAEGGSLRLYDYDMEEAEEHLTAACTEVSQEDALGAYCVSYLKFDLSTIVSHLEADISITYRRTQEQVDSIRSAIGPTAIRTAFGDALKERKDESVLRLDYYIGDEGDLEELLQRAYYETPSAAMGMPQASVEFYPRTGVQRIAEVTITYTMAEEVFNYTRSRMVSEAEEMVATTWSLKDRRLILDLCGQLMERGEVSDTGSTAYAAFFAGGATSEGLALAFALLCEQRDIYCDVVQGVLNGEAHFWNVVETEAGYRHIDLTTYDSENVTEDTFFQSDREVDEAGYRWNRDWVPPCGEQPGEHADDTLELY